MKRIKTELICAAELYCLAESPRQANEDNMAFVCTREPNHPDDFHEAKHVETGEIYLTWRVESLKDTV